MKFLIVLALICLTLSIKRFSKKHRKALSTSWGYYTAWNDYGDWEAYYLDRHSVDCGDNKALQGWNLEYNNDESVRIGYNCKSSIAVGTSDSTTTTDYQTLRKSTSGIEELSKIKVDCSGTDKAIQYFYHQRDGDKIRYKYRCVNIDSDGTQTSGETSEQDTQGWNDNYGSMKEHTINLDGYKVLSFFQIWYDDSGTNSMKIKYQYKVLSESLATLRINCNNIKNADKSNSLTFETDKTGTTGNKVTGISNINNHNLKCSDYTTLRGLHLVLPEYKDRDKVQFRYGCNEDGGQVNTLTTNAKESKYTYTNENSIGLIFSNTSVECGDTEALKKVEFIVAKSEFKISYDCVTTSFDSSSNVTTKTTASVNNTALYNLEYWNIYCDVGYALTSIKFFNNANNTMYAQYTYKKLAVYSEVELNIIKSYRTSVPVDLSTKLKSTYNIYYGNMYDNNDPGLNQNSVFQVIKDSTQETNGYKYNNFKGYTVRMGEVCRTTASAKIVEDQTTLSESFKSALNFGSIVGGVPFMGNANYVEWMKNLSDMKKSYVINTAECFAYQVVLQTYDAPDLDTGFIAALRNINTDYNETTTASQFHSFIESYGTHYISELQLGAKYILLMLVDASKIKSLRDQGINVNTEASKILVSTTSTNGTADITNAYFKDIVIKTQTFSVGPSYEQNIKISGFNQWQSETRKEPGIISYTLKSIGDLFSNDAVRTKLTAADSTLNLDKIQYNLNLALNNHCSYLYGLGKVTTCDSSAPYTVESTANSSGEVSTDEGNFDYFATSDSGKVSCGTGRGLAYFAFSKVKDEDKGYWQYYCVTSSMISSECYSYETDPVRDMKESDMDSFEKLKINCDDGKVLSSWQLTLKDDAVYMKYSCCVATVDTCSNSYKQTFSSLEKMIAQPQDYVKNRSVIRGFYIKDQDTNKSNNNLILETLSCNLKTSSS